MKQLNLYAVTKRRSVLLQLWNEHPEPYKAFVVLARAGSKPVDLARFVVIDLGAPMGTPTIGVSGPEWLRLKEWEQRNGF